METANAYRTALGRTVRALRSERGWSLRALSERAALSVPYLSEIENGQKEPSGAALEQLSRAFGISLADFLTALAASLEGRQPAARHLDAALQERLAGLSAADIAEMIQFAEWLRWRGLPRRAEDGRMTQ